MATRSIVGAKYDDHAVFSYVHYDGYPEGIGSELLKNFDDHVDAVSIAHSGTMKSVQDGKINDFDLEEYERAKKVKLTKINDHARNCGAEWIYLYDTENRTWLFADPEEICFQGVVPLTEEAINELKLY